LKKISNTGLESFLEQYQLAKKGKRKRRKVTDGLKNLIYEIRESERDCCGQKIEYFLKNDHNINLGTTTIYKVLREKYQLRSKWKKNQQRGVVPVANQPREVVQMDTVDFGDVFAFTAVDIFSKEVDVLLRPSLTSKDGLVFLKTSMERRFGGHVDLLQADGGPEFKAEFKKHVLEYCGRYRVARPYKKNEQSYIESFNRSLRKECLGWTKYKTTQLSELTREVEDYLTWYHYRRPHLGLNLKTPLPDF
jgi:transposase InsO family protein